MATNAGLIVFREGMEAVIILAALMSSMRRAEERRFRKPMWAGTGLALLATAGIWVLAHSVLQSLARYGEKLEAVVSLIAVAVLLVIMNWFLHKIYWTSWIASFHSRKRRLLSGEAGLILGLVALGFASVFREGFETVLFLQALVLEVGTTVVLVGTAAPVMVEAQVLINLADALPEGFERYERVVELVDQHPEVLAQSRERFRQYREQGCAPETHKL